MALQNENKYVNIFVDKFPQIMTNLNYSKSDISIVFQAEMDELIFWGEKDG